MALKFRTLRHAIFVVCFIVTAHCSLQNKRSAYSENSPFETWFRVTGLTAVSVYGTRAEVKWIESAGPVFGYELRVCTKWMPRECEKADIIKAGQKLQNLKPNTTYQVRVRPFDNSKPRNYGDQAVIEFDTLPFPVVQDLKATAHSPRSIQVTWAAPQEEVIGYTVHGYSRRAGFVKVDTNDTSVNLTNLSPEETYTIEVKTVRKEGDELSSGVPLTVSATTTALRAPTNVKLQATCEPRILASWDYAGDLLTGFELKLCEEGEQSCVRKAVSPESRDFSFNIAPRESMFTFSIQSSLHHFGLHLSEAVVLNTRSLKKAPRIEDFDVHPAGNKTVEVSWKAIQGGKFVIAVCLVTSSKNQCAHHESDGDVSKYRISDLEEGSLYTISASFRPTAEGPVCLDEISRNVTIPLQAPGNNAAQLSALHGLLVVMPLLYLAVR